MKNHPRCPRRRNNVIISVIFFCLGDGSTRQALLEKYLTLHPGKHVLLDGFPRSLDNARDWARLFGPPEACIR